jgi:predicted transcriptional regulator
MKDSKKITGRRCYDHLGGKLGKNVFDFLVENEYIDLSDGKVTVYEVTKKGEEFFKKIGMDM